MLLFTADADRPWMQYTNLWAAVSCRKEEKRQMKLHNTLRKTNEPILDYILLLCSGVVQKTV